MSSEWYVLRQDKKSGPYSSTILKQMASSGQLVPDDHIWKQGLTGWIPASRFAGLFSSAAPSPVPAESQSAAEPVQTARANRSNTAAISTKDQSRRVRLAVAWCTLTAACAGTAFFVFRSENSGKALVAADSNDNPRDPSNWSLKHYPKTNSSLRTAASLAANIEGDRENGSRLEAVVQRAILLREVAALQSEIGDIEGTDSTLALLRKLNPIAVGDAPLSPVIARANAGETFDAESARKIITTAFPIDGDSQTAKLLRNICLAYQDRNELDAATKILTALAAHSSSTADPSQKVLALGELGKAQVAMRRDDRVSETVRNLLLMTGRGAGLEDVRLAISDIAVEWAANGEFQKAANLIDLIGPSILADGCRLYVVQRQVAGFDFDGATEQASKIDYFMHRARALIEIQTRRLESAPVFVADALKAADEITAKSSPAISALRARTTDHLYSIVLSEAASSAARWRLASVESMPTLLRSSVVQRTADSENFVREALSDDLLKPPYRAKILLAAAIVAAKCDDQSSAKAFEECLKQVESCTELNERRWLLQEIAFQYDLVNRSEFVLSWAKRQSTYDRAAVYLGLGRSQRQSEDMEVVAVRGRIPVVGDIDPQASSPAPTSDMWNLLSKDLPADCRLGDGCIVSRGSYRFVVVPAANGVSIAFPSEFAGVRGWRHVVSRAIDAQDRESLIAAGLTGPLGDERRIGDYRITKSLARKPLEWLVITVQK